MLGAGPGLAEEKINQFIEGKKVVDIKLIPTNQLDEEEHPIVIALIMYD